jgi:PPOX class probable F420-dependent enzyme
VGVRHDGADRRIPAPLSGPGQTCENVPIKDFPDTHLDLLEGNFATLATLARDGSPQLTEIWFIYDDGQLKLSLNTARLKTKHLLARPQCSVFLLDLANPYRYVDIRGRAQIDPDDDYVLADKVGKKYESDLREHDAPGDRRVAVTIEPTRIFAVDMSR